MSQLVRGAHLVIGAFLGLGLSALLLWWHPDGLALIATVVLLQGIGRAAGRP